jgi:asparagine synthase (glutamine-hydrolysing)
MCGIAGIIEFRSGRVDEKRLRNMTDAIAHRGPDGEGQWIDQQAKVGLGHRRLSILDLSENGSQPMHYMDKYSIVFNGEIYNYIELKETLLKNGYYFDNGTDTQVLLAAYDAYGVNCLEKFDGMFAFAIYDRQQEKLFCARDRFGEKPFFFYFDKNHFLFGSKLFGQEELQKV